MKRTTTKQLLTVLILLAFSMTAMAQKPQSKSFRTEWDDANGIVIHEMSMPRADNKVHVKQLPQTKTVKPTAKRQRIAAKDEANMVKLNIEVVEHDDIVGYPYEVFMFRTSPHEFNYLELGENEVLPGTYNLFTEFTRKDADGFFCSYYVFKENVEIKADMTLTFDADEARNHVSVDINDINGDQLILPRGYFTEDGELCWAELVFLGFHGFGYLEYEGYGLFLESSGDSKNLCRLYISDVSEKLKYSFVGLFCKDNMLYTVNYFADHFVPELQLANDPKDFVIHEETFKPTPINALSDKNPYPVVNLPGWIAYMDHEMPAGKLTCCIGKTPQKSETFVMDIAFADYAWSEEEEWDGEIFYWNDERTTRSLPILNIDGKLSYYNLGQTSFFREDRVYEIDGERKTMGLFPSNPVFSYPLSQRVAPMIGNSCPMLDVDLLHYPYYEGDGALKQIDVFYKGRYGEQRESDNMVAHLLIKEGDEVVYDDALQGYTGYMWLDPHWDNGIVDVTLTNENIDVDGLHGKNVTKMQADKAKADRCPPSLSMLDFRTNDNMVTDRFATAADGILNFYACDHNFNVTEDWQYYWTVFKPTVEVSYTPYDTEDWKPLPVEEDPSLFFLPTMGYFYSGSLKDVTGAGREGWFDLKICLEDEAGNWQEQVISPAFRIDDLVDTGINDNNPFTIGNNPNATTVYDLMGRRIANDSSTPNKGVYIVNGRKVIR